MLARTRLAIALSLTVLSLAACTKTDLAFRPEPGQSRTYHVSSDSETTRSAAGVNLVQGNAGGFDITFDVQERQADGGATVKATFGKVELATKMSFGGRSIDFSAFFGADNPMAKSLAAVQGQTFTARIGPKGAVEDLQGVDAIYGTVRQGVGQGLAGAFKGQSVPDIVMQLIEREAGAPTDALLSPDAIRTWLLHIFANYPPEPVRKGSVWNERETIDRELPRIESRQITLTGIEGGVANMKFDLQIEPNPQGSPVEAVVGKGPLELNGKGSGTRKVDKATGWLVTSDESFEANGHIKAQGALFPGTVDIILTQKSHTTITTK